MSTSDWAGLAARESATYSHPTRQRECTRPFEVTAEQVAAARAEFDEMMRHTTRPFPCRLHDYSNPPPGGSPAPQERP